MQAYELLVEFKDLVVQEEDRGLQPNYIVVQPKSCGAANGSWCAVELLAVLWFERFSSCQASAPKRSNVPNPRIQNNRERDEPQFT